MPLDPRTPVLVGVCAVRQREDDPARAREPVELMIAALEGAAQDSGHPALLSRADSIRIPRGFWAYPDPGRLVAERFGARSARTEVAEIGVLQTTLFGRAAADIASGRSDVALVAGGEARHREQQAKPTGVPVSMTEQPPGRPDSVLRPDGQIISEPEIRAGLISAVAQYALIENALRASEGRSLAAHRREVAHLWSRLGAAAADNPAAWCREPVRSDALLAEDGPNRMLAFPYGKLHVSQWNVDQAAGLVLTSVETARSLGIPRDRWVFPHTVADANYMVGFVARRELDRCPGFALAAKRVFARAGCAPNDAEHLELYSCFPSAVRMQIRELGIDPTRPLSVTGGMAVAGGPLNNFVLQGIVRMAEVLRADPGSRGLVTAVSGFLTKQGVSLWSTEPASGGFSFEDATAETERATARVEVGHQLAGRGRIATYTVLYQDGAPHRAVLVCDLDDGRRAVIGLDDPALARELVGDEACGRAVRGTPESITLV